MHIILFYVALSMHIVLLVIHDIILFFTTKEKLPALICVW